MENCILCNTGEQQIRFVSMVASSKISSAPDNPILAETDNFYLTIDLHPVSDCHYLIIPKGHFTSYSLVPKEYEKELEFLIELVKEKTAVEDFILFEHGSGFVDEKLVSCGNSVFHAHMHFIGGLRYELDRVLGVMSFYSVNPKELFMKTIKPGESLLSTISATTSDGKCHHSPYLFLKFNSTDCFVMPEREQVRIQSQFFRRMFAEEVGGRGCFWNWKEGMTQVDKIVLQKRIAGMIAPFKAKTQDI